MIPSYARLHDPDRRYRFTITYSMDCSPDLMQYMFGLWADYLTDQSALPAPFLLDQIAVKAEIGEFLFICYADTPVLTDPGSDAAWLLQIVRHVSDRVVPDAFMRGRVKHIHECVVDGRDQVVYQQRHEGWQSTQPPRPKKPYHPLQ